ncbi:hypothetical protein BDQ12DRAFT_669777 [Crucibulum laeve]|uniref:Uncharacterized protein n=1 Tax=Crucibulum laeve TaxID=68775 RepID=A0A5C3LLH0_9AGAR|nr:hypothetical protein BDQ12DRAFT_669777 [Crucibulum laeve]
MNVNVGLTSTSLVPGLIIPSEMPSVETTSPSTSFPYTLTYTSVWTSTFPGGSVTTYSTVIETGVLSTDTPKGDAFAHNTGAIIGVSLGGALALILVVIGVFFGCRRYKGHGRPHNGSNENFLARGHPAVWRPPLDEDDDIDYDPYYDHNSSGASPSNAPPAHSVGHSGEGDFLDGSSNGGHGSASGTGSAGHRGVSASFAGGSGSVESGGPPPSPVRSSSFGGQPYMPGFGQTMDMASTAVPATMAANYSMPLEQRRRSNVPDPGLWLGGRDISSIYGNTAPPTDLSSHGHGSTYESAISLGPGSSSGHGATSSSSGHGAVQAVSRGSASPASGSGSGSGSGSRSNPHGSSTRHSNTPPTSFPLPQQNTGSDRPDSERRSVRSFLGRLSPRSRGSVPEFVMHNPSTAGHSSAESILPIASRRQSYATPPVGYTPSSLLNPLPTPPQLPSSSSPTSPFLTPAEIAHANEQHYSPTASVQHLWPPATLPPLPSPALTQSSVVAEGLLDPQLGRALSQDEQASMTSLRDNVDYTRPIHGLVNNRMYSSTTITTQGTMDTLDGAETAEYT